MILPTAGVFCRDDVITFTTPGGIPACSANCEKQSERQDGKCIRKQLAY